MTRPTNSTKFTNRGDNFCAHCHWTWTVHDDDGNCPKPGSINLCPGSGVGRGGAAPIYVLTLED